MFGEDYGDFDEDEDEEGEGEGEDGTCDLVVCHAMSCHVMRHAAERKHPICFHFIHAYAVQWSAVQCDVVPRRLYMTSYYSFTEYIFPTSTRRCCGWRKRESQGSSRGSGRSAEQTHG